MGCTASWRFFSWPSFGALTYITSTNTPTSWYCTVQWAQWQKLIIDVTCNFPSQQWIDLNFSRILSTCYWIRDTAGLALVFRLDLSGRLGSLQNQRLTASSRSYLLPRLVHRYLRTLRSRLSVATPCPFVRSCLHCSYRPEEELGGGRGSCRRCRYRRPSPLALGCR